MADGKAPDRALGRVEPDLRRRHFHLLAVAQGLEQRFFHVDVLPQQGFFNLTAPVQPGRLSGQGQQGRQGQGGQAQGQEHV